MPLITNNVIVFVLLGHLAAENHGYERAHSSATEWSSSTAEMLSGENILPPFMGVQFIANAVVSVTV